MKAGSYHELSEQQQALRKEVLAKLRAVKRGIGDLHREFEVSWREFLTRLDAAPRQVVYRYYQMRDALLDHLGKLEFLRTFLVGGRSVARIAWDMRLLDRAAVAKKLIGGRDSESLVSRAAVRKEALSVLDAHRSELQQRLASHNEAWDAMVDAARSILQCGKELAWQGIVSSDDRALEYLEEVLCYLFGSSGNLVGDS